MVYIHYYIFLLLCSIAFRLLNVWYFIFGLNIVTIAFTNVIFPLYWAKSDLQFMPLMLTSLVCAAQNTVSWAFAGLIVVSHFFEKRTSADYKRQAAAEKSTIIVNTSDAKKDN